MAVAQAAHTKNTNITTMKNIASFAVVPLMALVQQVQSTFTNMVVAGINAFTADRVLRDLVLVVRMGSMRDNSGKFCVLRIGNLQHTILSICNAS